MPTRVAVWMKDKEAHLFRILSPGVEDEPGMVTPHGVPHKHTKKGRAAGPRDAQRFFRKLGRSPENARKILLVGPPTAKLAFLRHVHRHDKALEPRIIGIETVAPRRSP